MGALKSLVRPRYTKRQKNPFPSFFSIENPRGNWLYVFITALLTRGNYETAPHLSTGILFFLQRRFLGKNPMRNAGCPLNRARPVWHYFEFFVRLASASAPSKALTLISRQSLHEEDGLRMDVFTFGIWEYVLCEKRFLKSSFKSSGGIGQF